MPTEEKRTRIVYHIHTKVKGIWFDKEFAAKDCKHDDNKRSNNPNGLSLAEAKLIAGDSGVIWKITTIHERVSQD